MPPRKNHKPSRRDFLKRISWAPALFIPSPIHAFQRSPFRYLLAEDTAAPALPFSDARFTPHYPAKSPLEDVLAKVDPAADDYVTEKYAAEIMPLLGQWSRELEASSTGLDAFAKFSSSAIEGSTLTAPKETPLRSSYGLEIYRRKFAKQTVSGRENFLREMKTYLSSFSKIEAAEFQIIGIKDIASAGAMAECTIRYELVGSSNENIREQRIGHWRTLWSKEKSWQAVKWEATEETLSRMHGPAFVDITAQALGQIDSYKNQMLHGVDHWRTLLDGACGIDVYGNNGVAVGDIDNDGFDEIYVCQPAGLPNRLYKNRGDGTFEDVTDSAGVGVLDTTSCALFADFENKGVQDLLVVCGNGPLLFLNQGNGKFALKSDAFKFARPPQGSFTHAALADYDRDGRLDVYFCVYSYYLGLDQYHYPAPYFDARNGPPNFLFHNQGDGTFADRTDAAGLNAENDRYSFSCAWGDSNSNGWPDLYVANDFGRSNLYRNNGDGTFTAISAEAGVQDAGAGMSACWADFNGDGRQDIYVANMWSAAGLRISEQTRFHEKDPENIREYYRQHAHGNSLYQNEGNGHFKNVAATAGVEMGRWAWSSDAWDFDHDGNSDIYIANGYISGADPRDLSSFFWRQVVGQSPQNALPSSNYERGWNAINELIRSDASWSGRERNVVYANNGDGTFTDVSGVLGLDFPDDCRSFALADIDHDGRLEIILKNRNAPQIRILRNSMAELGNSIAFRLRGTKSNRDAIGAAITIEADGRRQTKCLQAGSGFLSQHSKEIFFGVGKAQGFIKGNVRWPNGTAQTFERLPVNHRIEIVEGSTNFTAKPFLPAAAAHPQPGTLAESETRPESIETWLIQPLNAPAFSLPDLDGKGWELQAFRGKLLVLNFWQLASPESKEELQLFTKYFSTLKSAGIGVVAVNVDAPGDAAKFRQVVSALRIPFTSLPVTDDVAGVYNLIFRYLYDRRRDLPIPTSFLIDENGMIVKVYQGLTNPQQFIDDQAVLESDLAQRIRKALPFAGTLYQSTFQRNDFTYGVAFFQRGYLNEAAESFKQVLAKKPDDAEANYNLGTLYLRRNDLPEARRYLEQTVKLHSNYPEAWNNLGMVAAQEGRGDEAVRNFQQSVTLRPDYAVALVNLGNLYRRRKDFADAQKLFERALELEPNNAEFNYSFGMFYAQQDQLDLAAKYLQRAVSLRPGYPDAVNNLGVLLVRQERYPEAEAKFNECITTAPESDQAYMNLARLYVILNQKEKARQILQRLLERQPAHQAALQALDALR